MRPVLMVDDDRKLSRMLTAYCARHDIELTARYDGPSGLEEARSGNYDLMLLDITLPGMDGLTLLENLRTFSDLPVVLLTARGDAADRIRGLRLGADDYLPKPFDVEELVARIHAVLRRGTSRQPAKPAPYSPRIELNGLRLDLSARTACYGDQSLDLTNIELSLLETFLQSPGVVLSREDLMVRVFQRQFHPLDRSLDMYVSRLRRKLRSATPYGNHIKTIRSSGYLFSTNAPPTES